jgi:multicomponent Na+:H+ antiporter subunit G
VSPGEVLGAALVALGCGFYLAGTVGMLRFPDVFSRLHALTKADNLGLMLVCLGLAVMSASWRTALLLAAIWLLGLLAATVSAYLIARHARSAAASGSAPAAGIDAQVPTPPVTHASPHAGAHPAEERR